MAVRRAMEVRRIHREAYAAEGISGKDNFFGGELWASAHGDALRSYGIYNKDIILGAFHLYHYSRLGKQFIIDPPMSPHCGLELLLHGEKVYSRQSELKKMTAAVAAFLKREFQGAYISVCLPDHLIDVQAFQWEGFHTLPKYTYLLDLGQSEGDLLKQMSTERRKNIKNALEQDYEVRYNAPAEDVIGLVAATLERAGAPFKPDVLRYVLNHGGDNIFTAAVFREGRLRATAVCALDGSRAYYLAGGHNAASGDSLAGTLALWSAIGKAGRAGCVTFDFLGSSVPSIEKYFRGFGAQLKPYFNIQGGAGIISWLKKKRRKYAKP